MIDTLAGKLIAYSFRRPHCLYAYSVRRATQTFIRWKLRQCDYAADLDAPIDRLRRRVRRGR